MPRGKFIVRNGEGWTIHDAAQEFYKHNRVKGLAQATQEIYKVYISSFMKWCGEDTLLDDITQQLLEDYILYKSENGTKNVSIATNMGHLRRFFKFCAERDYMMLIKVTIPKYEHELKEPYTLEEMKLLLAE